MADNGAGQDEIVAVIDNPEESQYEVHVDGRPAGHVAYRRSEGVIDLYHTEVAEEYGGRGLAQRLAEQALTEAREGGLQVVPTCPFIAKYISKHPEHVDLVPADRREEFGLA